MAMIDVQKDRWQVETTGILSEGMMARIYEGGIIEMEGHGV